MQTTISIPQLHCPSCAALVRMAFDDVAWIQDVTVDLDAKTAIIVHDETQTPETLCARITEEIGYETSIM